MRIDIHLFVHNEGDNKVLELLNLIINQNKTIMKTQAQIAQELTDLKAEIDKVNSEVKAKLQALADAIANQGNASPEVETALADLTTSIKGVDDLIEDETPPTPGV